MDGQHNTLDLAVNINANNLLNCFAIGYRFDDPDNSVTNYGGFYYNHANGKIVYLFNGWQFYLTNIVLEYTKISS